MKKNNKELPIQKKSARERILAKAQELFYVQGFKNTGINQIIEESATAKASFYQYFKSKDDLALAYLNYYESRVVNSMARLMEKYPNMNEFIHAWTRLMKRDIKYRYKKNFNGCPFANFASQLEKDENTQISEKVQGIIDRMYNHFDTYFEKAIKAKSIKTNYSPHTLARRMVQSYEGAMMMAKITNDLSYVYELEETLKDLVKR